MGFQIFFFSSENDLENVDKIRLAILFHKIKLDKQQETLLVFISNFSCCFCIIHGRVMSPALLQNVVKIFVKSKLIFQYRLILFRMSLLITILSKNLTDFYKQMYTRSSHNANSLGAISNQCKGWKKSSNNHLLRIYSTSVIVKNCAFSNELI